MNRKTIAVVTAALILACSPPHERVELEPSHVDSVARVPETGNRGTAWEAISRKRPAWLTKPQTARAYLVLRCAGIECLRQVETAVVDQIRYELSGDGKPAVVVYLKRRVWVEGTRIAGHD